MTKVNTVDVGYTRIEMPPAGHPDWHRIRREVGVGASESAAALGLSPFMSRTELWTLKRGLSDPFNGNRATRLGNCMESGICEEFQLEVGIKGCKPTWMARSTKYPWMTANLDFLSDDEGAAGEIKRSNAPQHWGESGTQDVPDHYFIQCQHQMIVVPTLKVVYLVVLLPYDELRIYPITPREDIQQDIISGTKEFWDMVMDGKVPELDELDMATPESIKRIYRPETFKEQSEIVLPDPLSATVEAYLDAKDRIKHATKEAKSLEAVLLSHVGDNARAVIPDRYVITRSKVAKAGHYVQPTEYMQMRIKEVS